MNPFATLVMPSSPSKQRCICTISGGGGDSGTMSTSPATITDSCTALTIPADDLALLHEILLTPTDNFVVHPNTHHHTRASASASVTNAFDTQHTKENTTFTNREQGGANIWGTLPVAEEEQTCKAPKSTSRSNKSVRKHATPTYLRRKDETEYLREKVKELQREVWHLRRNSRRGLSTGEKEDEGNSNNSSNIEDRLAIYGSPGSKAASGAHSSLALWESIGERQRKAVWKARLENKKLRELVKGQVRVMKSLEQALKRKGIFDDMQQNMRQLSMPPAVDERSIYAMLAKDLDLRYLEVDSVLLVHGLTHRNRNMDDAVVHSDADNGISLEMKQIKTLPFAYQATQEMMWKCIQSHTVKINDGVGNIVESSENTISMKIALTLRLGKMDLCLTIRSTYKRFIEKNRMVMTWETQSTNECQDTGDVPSITLCEKGWGTIAPLIVTNGSPATIIKIYVSSVSEKLSPKLEESKAALADMLITFYRQKMRSFSQVAEDFLMDALLNTRQ